MSYTYSLAVFGSKPYDGMPMTISVISVPNWAGGGAVTKGPESLSQTLTGYSVQYLGLSGTEPLLSGKPYSIGSYSVKITITSGSTRHLSGATITQTLSITDPNARWPEIFEGQVFDGKVGNNFFATIALRDALNRPAGAWWVAEQTSLPAGLSLNPLTGTISGTAEAAGSFTTSFIASGTGQSPATSVTFNISAGAPIIAKGHTFFGKFGFWFYGELPFDPTLRQDRPVTAWAATGLPSWATLNTTTGAITGTPSLSAQEVTLVTLAATGPGGTDEATATIWLGLPPIITSGQSFTGKVGDVFSGTIALTDALNRPATSWVATGLPAGIAINATTGAISGTPTTKGSFTARFTAANRFGDDGVNIGDAGTFIAFTISEGAPIIAAGQTGSGAVGAAFTKTFPLTDSTNRPVTSWAATGLPGWATLNAATGAITGTPQDSGSTTATLTATGPGGTDTETVTISIALGAPIITAGQSFTGKVGDVFSGAIALTDALDRPATSWSATGLPAGLAINATTGAITGTPTTKGSFTAIFTATGGGGTSANADVAFTISEGAPIIAAGQTGSGTVGAAFTKTFSLTDSTNRPVTSWAATGLPGWATLNAATGAITGTPQDSGSTTVTLTATGPGGTSAATAVTISIALGAPIITAGQSFTGKVGDVFSGAIALTDALDRPATSWSATGLPAGLAINATTGAISGTPTTKGSFTAWFMATVSQLEVNVLFTISEGAPIIAAGQTGSGALGAAFTKTFSLTDSTNRPVTSWAATGLPGWATLNAATGAITGTPQDSGSTTVTLTVTGPGGSDTDTVTISIALGAPIITAGQSFTGKVGDVFSGAIALTDALDRPATSWSATGLPAGLAINATTGAISGTPTTKGSFTASFTATGVFGASAAASVAFTISEGAPIITAGQTVSGVEGARVYKTFLLTDSTNRPATSWAATGLPAGLSINATTGTVTGTLQFSGSATVLLAATGPGGTDTETATILIATGPPIITAGQSLTGKVGEAFTQTISMDRAATSWAIASGSLPLPLGLTLNTATGAISGVPTVRGLFTARFTASNASAAATMVGGSRQIVSGSFNLGTLFNSADALSIDSQIPSGDPGFWTSTYLRAIASDGNEYLFAYTYTGADWIVRKDVSTGVTVAVVYMGGGSKPGENSGFQGSTTDQLAWGTSIYIDWGYLLQPNTSYQNILSVPGSSYNGSPAVSTAVSFAISEGAPIITAGQGASGKAEMAFSKTFFLTDSANRPVSSWAATGLPAGLSINATTGAITGAPLMVGDSVITLSATGAGGTGTETATISITGNPVRLEPIFEVVCNVDVNVYLNVVLAINLLENASINFEGIDVNEIKVNFQGLCEMDASGSWELYRDFEAFLGVAASFQAKFIARDILQFAWGEFDLAKDFRGEIFLNCYTTIRGRVTPTPFAEVGLKLLDSRLDAELYRDVEGVESRPFDLTPALAQGVLDGVVSVSQSKERVVYNVWAEQMPPPGVQVHLSVYLKRSSSACASMLEEVADLNWQAGSARTVKYSEWDLCAAVPVRCQILDAGWQPGQNAVPYPFMFLQTNQVASGCLPASRLERGEGIDSKDLIFERGGIPVVNNTVSESHCVTPWLPDPATVCYGVVFTQSSCDCCVKEEDCKTTLRSAVGSKPLVWSEWVPNAAAYCPSDSVKQTRYELNGCAEDQAQTVSGTMAVGAWGLWGPQASSVCLGVPFQQVRVDASGCSAPQTQSATGTMSPVWSEWSPAASSVCSGETFQQTRQDQNGCAIPQSQSATGTRSCSCSNSVSDESIYCRGSKFTCCGNGYAHTNRGCVYIGPAGYCGNAANQK